MMPKEFQIMLNMIKSAINSDREFTHNESARFDDLFKKISEHNLKD